MFKDKEQLQFFEKEGYLKTPLLSVSEVEELKNLYLETKHSANVDAKFYTSIWSNDSAYKAKVDAQLKSTLVNALKSKLDDFKAVFANFMVKKTGEGTQLHPHQDWSFVEEPNFQSITVWIPLVNVDKNNGALEVCPKSNLLENYVRARFLNSPFSDNTDYIQENLMKSIPMKMGEALFVNSRTIHSSPCNMSNADRIAVSIVIVPKEAQMIHYVQDKLEPELIHKLNVDEDFYIKYSAFDYPEIANAVEKFSLKAKVTSLEDLKRLV